MHMESRLHFAIFARRSKRMQNNVNVQTRTTHSVTAMQGVSQALAQITQMRGFGPSVSSIHKPIMYNYSPEPILEVLVTHEKALTSLEKSRLVMLIRTYAS